MDPHRAVDAGEWVVVTHAHADHTARHKAVILTEPTRRLMRSRLPGSRIEQVLAYSEAWSGDGRTLPGLSPSFALTLHPAGHVLGSAMVHLSAGDDSLLYTGDFKLRPGRSSERCQPVHARTLIMETTYGRPRYEFPPTETVIESILQFCRQTLSEGLTPVLIGYSLGKSQEILASLTEADLPIQLHPSAARLTEIYSEFGCRFPAWKPLDVESARGHVIITPTLRPLVAAQPRIGPLRVASLSGWALDHRPRTDTAGQQRFPLSDHADFPDLMRFVEAVKPERVYTLHGFAAEFARHLRRRGVQAYALSQNDQLELSLGI
jgi:DNA ligase-1